MNALKTLAVCVALAAACNHAKPAAEPATTAPAVAAQPAPAVVLAFTPAPVEPVPAPVEPAPEPVEPAPRQSTASIYFEFDRFDLSEEARAILADLAQAASADGAVVRVEGNCDERGSVEYNIALGQRRADAAQAYLVRLGVPAARITAISFGEEMPKAPGHDEASWRENRRDDIFVSGPPAVSAR